MEKIKNFSSRCTKQFPDQEIRFQETKFIASNSVYFPFILAKRSPFAEIIRNPAVKYKEDAMPVRQTIGLEDYISEDYPSLVALILLERYYGITAVAFNWH